MARKRTKSSNSSLPQSAPKSRTPWYKRAWVLISGTSVIVTAILLNAPTLLQNARIIPKEVRETTSQFWSWVKEDSEWTGHWSSFPEGIVDMEDMQLSDVDMQITIWASQGEIDGTIATKEICKSIPVFNYVLLRGKVFGNTAHVTAWDIIQGHKTNFAELKLNRNGDVITVTPVSGHVEWFPASAQLGRHPLEAGAEPEPDQTFCDQERKSFFDKQHSSTQNRANNSFNRDRLKPAR